MNHHRNRQYAYLRDPSPEPINLVKLYLFKIPPAKVHGFRVKLSQSLMLTPDFLMHMGVQPVHEFQVARGPQHPGTNRIAMGRYQEHHLLGLVVFLMALLVQRHLNSLLHLGLRVLD